MKVNSVAIQKGQDLAAFEVGGHIRYGDKDTADTVIWIKVSLFGKVTVKISNGKYFVFRKYAFSYER